MKFATFAAAFITAPVLLSPANRLIRRTFELLAPDGYGLSGVRGVLAYVGVLLVAHGVLVMLVALGRWCMVWMESWKTSGLDRFDFSARGRWAWRTGIVVAFSAVAAVVLLGGGTWAPLLAELLVGGFALVLGLGGKPPPDLPVDEYDPLPHPQLPEPVPSPEPAPAPGPDDAIPLTLGWYFRNDPGEVSASATAYAVKLIGSKMRLEEFRKRDHRPSPEEYGAFVRTGVSPEVLDLAAKLRGLSDENGLDQVCEINNVLAFAQRFRYQLDEEGTGQQEYWKYPIETLVDDAGDCEDHAVLAAACLKLLGYDVRLVHFRYEEGAGHIALAVASPLDLPEGYFLCDGATSKKYFFCEVSVDARARDPIARLWRMGQLPEERPGASLRLIPIP